MTPEQLREVRIVIGDMRFVQAASLVTSGLSETKQAKAYMSRLSRLEKIVSDEITKAQKGM